MIEAERLASTRKRVGGRSRLRLVLLACAGLFALASVGISLISFRNTIAPGGIVIHHSVLPPMPTADLALDAKWIDEVHRQRGSSIFYWGRTYHIGYHYVILPDGTVQQGRPERCQGAHAHGYNSYLGICLIGDFDSTENAHGERGLNQPTRAQMQSLVALTKQLRERYQIPLNRVVQHKELNPDTKCPGDLFPIGEFRRSLGNEVGGSVEPWNSYRVFRGVHSSVAYGFRVKRG